MHCFAEWGFSKTSIRQIAAKAKVNVAAISYYFGGKAGIYRAAYTEPMGTPKDDMKLFISPELSLDQALHGLYSGFIEPLKQNEQVQQCIRLHMREMIEPTGLWDEEISDGIGPYHEALVALLCRHLKLKKPDDDVYRLATSIVALGVYQYIGRDVNLKLHPRLVDNAKALDLMTERLTDYARAMVDAEIKRRAKAPT